ncbi:MAG TPA: enoyl-CoA hydratase-related protein, partial [Polyangiales bacterium]
MAYRTLDVSFEGPIAQLKLSRPEALNSLTREFWSELPEALRAIDAEGKARVVVLSSTGKHFTAGMDLAVFGGAGIAPMGDREVGRTREALRHSVLQLQDSLSELERIRVPVL